MLGIQQKSTWHLLHRLRENFGEFKEAFPYAVEVDETHVGGRFRSMHRRKRKENRLKPNYGKSIVVVAREKVSAARPGAQVREVVTDKGYHSRETVLELKHLGLRSYISEPDHGRQRWKGQAEKQKAVYANRRRVRGARGKRLQRQRSERVERPFKHRRETGGLRRIFVRGHANVRKRRLVQVCGFNLGLLMRHRTGVGTPRSLQGRVAAAFGAQMSLWCDLGRLWGRFWASVRPDSSIYAPEIYPYAVSRLS